MGKRFTDSEKWRDKWFRALRPEYKLAWIYFLDNCDHAGVIELDEDLADFQIGTAINWKEFLETAATRIIRLANGKVFIRKFVEYQYGKLSTECRPHLPVIQRLQDHGIDISTVRQKETFTHGSVTQKRRLDVFERDGFICCYCGEKFASDELQADHLIPKTKGGTDAKDNLVAACVQCNAQKSDKDFAYFVSTLENPDEVWKRVSQRVSERVLHTLKEQEQEQEQETEKGKGRRKEEGGAGGNEDSWVIPPHLDCEDVRKLLDAFAEMRRLIKKPIKSLENTSAILKRFDDRDHLIFALEFCIANEYQGLKPDYRPSRGGAAKKTFDQMKTENTVEAAKRFVANANANGF